MSDDRFYIRLRGRVQGPFNADQLHSLARSGQFSRLHEVSGDGQVWSPAKDRPELFPRVAPAPMASVQATSARTPDDKETFSLAPAPSGNGQSSNSGAQWFYACGGVQSGPTEFAELIALAGAGRIRGDDLVWSPGMDNWTAARQVPGLITDLNTNWNSIAATSPPATMHAAPSAAPSAPGLAVASLVLGLLSIAVGIAAVALEVVGMGLAVMVSCVLASVVAAVLGVVFGHSAAGQIKRSPDLYSGGGLAATGMVCGYIVLAFGAAVILLIAALLLLGLIGARSLIP
jgi:hypothetical protein